MRTPVCYPQIDQAIVPAIAKTVVWWGVLDTSVDFLIANFPRIIEGRTNEPAQGPSFTQRFKFFKLLGREAFANHSDLARFFEETVELISSVKDTRDLISHGVYGAKFVAEGGAVRNFVTVQNYRVLKEFTYEQFDEVPNLIAHIYSRLLFLSENVHSDIEKAFGFSDEQIAGIREILGPIRGPRIPQVHDY